MKYSVIDLEEKTYDMTKVILNLYENDVITEFDYEMLMKHIEILNHYIQKNI